MEGAFDDGVTGRRHHRPAVPLGPSIVTLATSTRYLGQLERVSRMIQPLHPVTRRLVEEAAIRRKLPTKTPPWVLSPLMNVSGLEELNRAYGRLPSDRVSPNPFQSALDQLRIRVDVDVNTLDRIPQVGATVVLANHPFGGADGLALAATVLRRRQDVRVLVNSWLGEVEMLKSYLIQVDVFEAKPHLHENAASLRAALRHLRQGGALIVFPAGEVSQLNALSGTIEDPKWATGAATLARRSGATVVPCFFRGNNRMMFHLAGLLHPMLRTALLPRELVARQNQVLSLVLGKPVRNEALSRFASDEALTDWFRTRVYDLDLPAKEPFVPSKLTPVARPLPGTAIADELRGLPADALLLEQGPYRIYLAKRRAIPSATLEIGRLRELTFRDIGEGTGAETDIDRFDDTYHHLILWDGVAEKLVGAYRLAFCDEVLATEGIPGLYTHSLFRLKAAVKPELTSAIELGRSFIRPEYQRKPLPLALLWRGIGELLCRRPKYRKLVGSVSISERYRGAALRLLLGYLQSAHAERRLQRLVGARYAVRYRLSECERRLLGTEGQSAKSLSLLLAELDDEGKRVPVLLERYLELGAKVISISRDPSFGNCVDALVMVDLDRAPTSLLKRFMGTEGFEWYVSQWLRAG